MGSWCWVTQKAEDGHGDSYTRYAALEVTLDVAVGKDLRGAGEALQNFARAMCRVQVAFLAACIERKTLTLRVEPPMRTTKVTEDFVNQGWGWHRGPILGHPKQWRETVEYLLWAEVGMPAVVEWMEEFFREEVRAWDRASSGSYSMADA